MAFISMILLRMLISKVSRSTRPTPYITNILKGRDTLASNTYLSLFSSLDKRIVSILLLRGKVSTDQVTYFCPLLIGSNDERLDILLRYHCTLKKGLAFKESFSSGVNTQLGHMGIPLDIIPFEVGTAGSGSPKACASA